MSSKCLIIRNSKKSKAGNCINPAPPPEIAENVLEINEIKNIKKLFIKLKSLLLCKYKLINCIQISFNLKKIYIN